LIFVLDNYDSFTYNLVQYIGELGAEVEVRRNDQFNADARFAGKVPVLGVCLGHQAIGAAFGGQVVRAKTLMHGKTSSIEHDGRTIFCGIDSPTRATRYHSLIVAEDGLPRELEVTAWTHDHDGTRVTMGLRHRRFPVEGVQFHPESVLTNSGKKMVENFLGL